MFKDLPDWLSLYFMDLMVMNFKECDKGNKLHGFNIPKPGTKEARYFKWAMNTGQHMVLMPIVQELLGRMPNGQDWAASELRVHILLNPQEEAQEPLVDLSKYFPEN